MEAKKTISKIAELLAVELAKKTKEVALATAKLENGTVLEAEVFEPGEAVFIATEDENVALPVGEYEMEDQKILVVTEEGIISEIKEVSAEEEEEEAPVAEEEEVEMAEEEVVVEAPEEVAPEVQQIVESVVEVIAPVIEEVKEQVEEMKRKMAEYEKQGEEEKVEMSRKPARKPIKANPEAQSQKEIIRFAQNGRKSTLDRVLGKISNR